MAKGRPAIIASKDRAQWMSCRIITPNLIKAYRALLGDDADYFSFTLAMMESERSLGATSVWKLADEIHAARPDRLIFVDHQPHPYVLLKALAARYGSKALPPIYVHIFGDFSLFIW